MKGDQLITVRLGKTALRFIRRPVTTPPPDGTICLIDVGTETRMLDRQPAKWASGAWTTTGGNPLKVVPTHWTQMLEPVTPGNSSHG